MDTALSKSSYANSINLLAGFIHWQYWRLVPSFYQLAIVM